MISTDPKYQQILSYLKTSPMDVVELHAVTGLDTHLLQCRLRYLREKKLIQEAGRRSHGRGRATVIYKPVDVYVGELPTRYQPEFKELKRDPYEHRNLAMSQRR